MSTFYIASLKHTHKGNEHIVWWGRFHCGYTPVIGAHAGRYCFGEAVQLNDGLDCIAVPTSFVESIASPEPYWKPGARFYDQRGPVVGNTKAIWDQIIAASLTDSRYFKPKPEVFRGAPRSFAWRAA